MTRSVAWSLVRSGHLLRSLRLAPFATGAAAIAAFLIGRGGDTDAGLADLRVIALLLVLSSGYVLDDGAAITLQASPYGLARRLWLRLACALALVVPLWTVMLVHYFSAAPTAERRSLGLGLTLELAAGLAVLWAVAAWGRRFGFDHPGIATTPALLALLLLATSLPKVPMLVGPGPDWTPAHQRWAGILLAAVCLLLAAMRDPAARRRGR